MRYLRSHVLHGILGMLLACSSCLAADSLGGDFTIEGTSSGTMDYTCTFARTLTRSIVVRRASRSLTSITVRGLSHQAFTERTHLQETYTFAPGTDTVGIPVTFYALHAPQNKAEDMDDPVRVRDAIEIAGGATTRHVSYVGTCRAAGQMAFDNHPERADTLYTNESKTIYLTLFNYTQYELEYTIEPMVAPYRIGSHPGRCKGYDSVLIPVHIDGASALPDGYEAPVRVVYPWKTSLYLYTRIMDTLTQGQGPVRWSALDIPLGYNTRANWNYSEDATLFNNSDEDVLVDSVRILGGSMFNVDQFAAQAIGAHNHAYRMGVGAKGTGDGVAHEATLRAYYKTLAGVPGTADARVFFGHISGLPQPWFVTTSPTLILRPTTATETITTRTFFIKYQGNSKATSAAITSIACKGDYEGLFQVQPAAVLPITVADGDSVPVVITFTDNGNISDTAFTTLTMFGTTSEGYEVAGYIPIRYTRRPDDTIGVRVLGVYVEIPNKRAGQTAGISFMNSGALAERCAYADVAISYNGDILKPITPTVDVTGMPDPVRPVSTFRLPVSSRSDNGRLGTVEFTVQSRTVRESGLRVESVSWFDDAGIPLDLFTEIRSNVVLSLDDEHGAGDPALRAFPVPVQRNALLTLTYDASVVVSSLALFSANGAVVVEMTHLAGAGGRVEVSTTGLAPGVYAVRMVCASGAITRLVVVE